MITNHELDGSHLKIKKYHDQAVTAGRFAGPKVSRQKEKLDANIVCHILRPYEAGF